MRTFLEYFGVTIFVVVLSAIVLMWLWWGVQMVREDIRKSS